MPDPKDPGPEDYAYFLDFDPATRTVTVFAAATNHGLYPGAPARHTGPPGDPHVVDTDDHGPVLEGFGAVLPAENSGVAWTRARRQHLGPRLQNEVARALHPRLFDRIGAEGSETEETGT